MPFYSTSSIRKSFAGTSICVFPSDAESGSLVSRSVIVPLPEIASPKGERSRISAPRTGWLDQLAAITIARLVSGRTYAAKSSALGLVLANDAAAQYGMCFRSPARRSMAPTR